MKDLIERLKIVQEQLGQAHLVENATMEAAAILIAAAAELSAIIPTLENLDQEHTRQTDELRGLREEYEGIRLNVQQRRREWQLWEDDGISCLEDDVAFLLTSIGGKAQAAEDDAAAMRGVLETIVTRGIDPDVDTEESRARRLDHLAYLAKTSLGSATGAALRKDIRETERICGQFEKQAEEMNSWYRNGSAQTLAQRVQAIVNHYNRTAADAISRTKAIQDEMTTWLQGLRIVAEMVGNGGTHREKDARLRGMTEVIESALTKMQQKRVQAGYDWYDWRDVFQGDYPTREYVRKIHELEDELKRLNGSDKPPNESDYNF